MGWLFFLPPLFAAFIAVGLYRRTQRHGDTLENCYVRGLFIGGALGWVTFSLAAHLSPWPIP